MFLQRLFCCCRPSADLNQSQPQAQANQSAFARSSSVSSILRKVSSGNLSLGSSGSTPRRPTPRASIEGQRSGTPTPRSLSSSSPRSEDLIAHRLSVYHGGRAYQQPKIHTPTIENYKDFHGYLKKLCEDNPETLIIDLSTAHTIKQVLTVPLLPCQKIIFNNIPPKFLILNSEYQTGQLNQTVTLTRNITQS